jgi:phosphoglycerate dehydrogenase-like enzyme
MPQLDGTVLVTWIGYDPDDPETGARLRDAGLLISTAPKLGARSSAEVAELSAGAVAAIVSTDPFDRTVFAASPTLRVIARVGVGTDAIDLRAATDAGVLVMTTPGANRETTADHALALILASLRRIVEHDASVRGGEWRRADGLTPWELHRATVGLIGYGDIGRAVARRLAGFGVRLLICDPALSRPAGGELVALEALLEQSDVVSLHLPLMSTTRGIVGARELDRMRDGATLVNTSRGGLVEQDALIANLASGRLRAALDVFAEEPHVPPSLTALPNVVLSPHIGGLSHRSIAAMTRRATANVLAALHGEPDPAAVANPDVLHAEMRR